MDGSFALLGYRPRMYTICPNLQFLSYLAGSSIFSKHPFRQVAVILQSILALNGYIVRHEIESIPSPQAAATTFA